MAGLEDLLPTPVESATPEQIQMMREYGRAMATQPGRQGPYGAWNALDTITGRIFGAMMMKHAGELQKGGLSEASKAVPTFEPTGGASAGGGGSSAPSPAPTSSDQTAATPEGGAPKAPVTNAADISSRLETGANDPMKGLANISPDTNGSKSYGNFGLNSQPGYSAHDFKRDYGEKLGLTATPGTAEFDAQWKRSAATNAVAHRASEVDWFNKNVVSGVTDKLEKVGVASPVASDPRVTAYFADRVVQQGPGSITADKHAARIQAAYGASGDDPVKFLKSMSAADRTPEALHSDFPRALASGVYSQRGHDNRVMGREAMSLGLQPPEQTTKDQAIGPIVNALAGKSGNTPLYPMNPGAPGAPEGLSGPTGTSMAMPANAAIGQGAGPSPDSLAGTIKAIGVPSPQMSPTQALAPQAVGGGASGPAPQDVSRAIAGPAAAPRPAPAPAPGVRGPDIPPTPGMPALPTSEQIQKLSASGIPHFQQMGKEMMEMRQKALTPQQITDPMTGGVYVGNQYTGFYKSGLPGMPAIQKAPYEVGGLKGENFFTLGRGENGQIIMNPLQTARPAGSSVGAATGASAGLEQFPENGTVAEKVGWANRNKTQLEEQEAYSKKMGDTYAAKQSTIEKRAADAQDELPQLETLQKVIKNPAFYSGYKAGNVEAISSALRSVGYSGDTATLMQYAKKLGSAASLENIREMGESGAVRVPEMHMIERSNFDIDNTPAANSAIVDIRLRLAQRQMETADLANAYADAHGGKIDRNFDQVLREHYKDKPLFSKGEVDRYDHILSSPKPPSGNDAAEADAKAAGVPMAALSSLASNPTPERLTAFEKHFDLHPGSAAEMIKRVQSAPPPAAPQPQAKPPFPQAPLPGPAGPAPQPQPQQQPLDLMGAP